MTEDTSTVVYDLSGSDIETLNSVLSLSQRDSNSNVTFILSPGSIDLEKQIKGVHMVEEFRIHLSIEDLPTFESFAWNDLLKQMSLILYLYRIDRV